MPQSDAQKCEPMPRTHKLGDVDSQLSRYFQEPSHDHMIENVVRVVNVAAHDAGRRDADDRENHDVFALHLV